MKRKPVPPFRLSERVHLRPGDLLRVSGGPVYLDCETIQRLGHRGVVRFDRAIESRGRPYLVVRTIESVGRGGALLGRYLTLYVGTEPYRNPMFPRILNRPYRVRRVRRKSR